MASSKQGFQTGREVGGESGRKREEHVRREWERWRVKERRSENGRKTESDGMREKAGIAPEWQSRLHFRILGSKTILSCSPSFPCILIYLSLPSYAPPPLRGVARISPHLSLFLFPLIFFLLWIIYCSRGEWKCVYFACVCALNRMLNDCRWERDCINPIYVETF